MKRKCIVLTGPTAVGKTSLSLKLAERLQGSVVSADCIQVYRGLDIGSDKITKEEQRGIPHYLIDVLDPEIDFDVTRFCKMAGEAIDEIESAGRLPIITGGTGFYIQALLKGVDFNDEAEGSSIREELRNYAQRNGNHALHEMLREVDAESADAIHENNVKRVIRAIEFFRLTGTRISEHNRTEREKEPLFTYAYFVINDDRKRLYERIDRRVDLMMENGLLQEVEALRDRGLTKDHLSMKGIGYAELLSFLNGEGTYDEAISLIKQNSRHYAKRQLTWFRREKDVIWIDRQSFDEDEDRMTDFMIREWDRIQNENTEKHV